MSTLHTFHPGLGCGSPQGRRPGSRATSLFFPWLLPSVRSLEGGGGPGHAQGSLHNFSKVLESERTECGKNMKPRTKIGRYLSSMKEG